MYVFLFFLAPLAIVIAWALARDRRRRRYIRGADIHSGVESAKDQATRWTLRITQDEQGGLTEAFADAWADRDLPCHGEYWLRSRRRAGAPRRRTSASSTAHCGSVTSQGNRSTTGIQQMRS